MKTALLHYWMINMRGGENLLAELAEMYPDADIFTHACRPENMSAVFRKHRITESMVGRLPFARRCCQKYLCLMPLALRRWDLSGYDLIISSESGPVKRIISVTAILRCVIYGTCTGNTGTVPVRRKSLP